MLVPTSTYRAGAFVRSARAMGLELVIASEKPSSLEKFLPNELVTLDFDDPEKCAGDMENFAASHRIDAVVGIDDQVTIAASAIGERLALPHNPIDAARATRNKHTMRKRLAEAGVPIPRFGALRIDDRADVAARGLSFPSVIKPLAMAASRGVVRVNTTEEFVRAFHAVAEIVRSAREHADGEARNTLLVEDYVPGWEVAVEGILTAGRLHVFAIFDKPDPLVGPYFPETIYVTPSRLRHDVQARIEAITQAGCSALGLRHGPIHAELRGDGDRMWFIEVAARSIGGYCSKVLRFANGRSLEDVILSHALDPEYAVPDREENAAGVMMLQAPRAGRLVEIAGVDEASRIEGIDEIIMSSRRGERLTPLPEGFLYVGFIFARRETPEAVEASLRAALQRIDIVIDPAQ
jgi:biotin carboxylase